MIARRLRGSPTTHQPKKRLTCIRRGGGGRGCGVGTLASPAPWSSDSHLAATRPHPTPYRPPRPYGSSGYLPGLFKKVCHQLRIAETAGLFQAAQSLQGLDGSEQRVVIVGGSADKLLLISRSQYQCWRVGASQNMAINTNGAVAATVGAGKIIFFPYDDEGRF